MEKKLKEKLARNERTLGCFVNFYSPSLVEMIGYAGYDFVVIDNEHGAFSISELGEVIRAAKLAGISSVIRVSYDQSSIQKSLDQGAEGIQVPMVNNVKDAREVVSQAKYPPIGNRGVAYSIPAAKYGHLSGRTFLDQSNESVFISVHIETKEAVENFEEIINVSGIDVAFIGTVDLAVNMGYDDPNHEAVQTTVTELFEKAKQYDIKMGMVASSEESVLQAFDRGADYVSIVSNNIITNALKNLVSLK